ncbi:MAG: glycosyltransferase family 4 protein [Deltaproteobacteria bacterium]
MKTLLVFTENYSRGGGNRYMIDAINSLADRFEGITLACNEGGVFEEDLKRLTKKVAVKKVHFITKARVSALLAPLPTAVKKLLLGPLFLLEPLPFIYNTVVFTFYIAALRPTATFAFNGGYPAARATLAFVVASRLVKVPTVLSIVSTPAVRKRISAFYEALIDRLVWNSASAIIVNAEAISKELQDKRGTPGAKVHVVHNGLERKSPLQRKESTEGTFVIGCVARTDRAKGVICLFEAFINLAKRYPQIRLVLVGRGDAQDELERRREASGIKDRIELTGFYNGDVDALLASFDLYVFPSFQEGFPYSILEAMRAGCPIVSTNVGGIPEAIRDSIEGLLVEPNSVAQLQASMERMILDKELRARLGKSALRRFEKDFVLTAMHKRLGKVFKTTVAQKS